MTIEEAKLAVSNPEELALRFIRRFGQVVDCIEAIDPSLVKVAAARHGTTRVRENKTTTIQGASGFAAIENTIGLTVGECVNYTAGGTVTRADYTTAMCNYVVGKVIGSTVYLYGGFASGAVILDGAGTSSALWLGQNGKASLQPPPLGNGYYQQSLGFRIGPQTSGLVTCEFIPDARPERR